MIKLKDLLLEGKPKAGDYVKTVYGIGVLNKVRGAVGYVKLPDDQGNRMGFWPTDIRHLKPTGKKEKGKNLWTEGIKLNEGLSEEARELKLYIDNDSRLYDQRYIPILKNLSNKKKRNKFSKSLAVKAFMYLVDDGAKRYTREFGGNPKDIFPKSKRTELAKEYVDEFESIFKNKEHDFMEQIR